LREDEVMTETLANRRIFRSKVDTIRPTYGFEDVSLAPGTDTVDPADIDLAQVFCGIPLEVPVLAAAMDAVADVRLSAELARLGGLAVLNLEGVQARYDDPSGALDRIIDAPDDRVHDVLAEVYAAPISTRPGRGLPSRRPPASRGGSARSAPSTAPTCSSSSRRSRRRATSRPGTSRSPSPTSPGSCRSRSRSATRPTPRPRTS
jgi:hypothetical protein